MFYNMFTYRENYTYEKPLHLLSGTEIGFKVIP